MNDEIQITKKTIFFFHSIGNTKQNHRIRSHSPHFDTTMSNLWHNLDKEYKDWLCPNICTPQEYERSSLTERAQLRIQFLNETTKRDNDVVNDRNDPAKMDGSNVGKSCPSPTVIDIDKTSDEEEDRKPVAIVIPQHISNKRKFTKVSTSNPPCDKETGRKQKSPRRGWCWLLTKDESPSIGSSELNKTRNITKREESPTLQERRRHPSWNWLLAPDGSPSMGTVNESTRQQSMRHPMRVKSMSQAEMDVSDGRNDDGTFLTKDSGQDVVETNDTTKNNHQQSEGVASNSTTRQSKEESRVKKEEEHESAKRDAFEKYGDRLLLHRFDGIGLLGGGMQHTFSRPRKGSPKIWNGDQLRLGYPLPEMGLKMDANRNPEYDMDAFASLAYSTLWQVNGPKFAGQPAAAVDKVPQYMKEKGLALPVFMKRSLTKKSHRKENRILGWEYVGNYRCITDSDLVTWECANNFTQAGKHEIATKYLKSSQCQGDDTYGRRAIDRWRNLLTEEEKKETENAIDDPKSLFARAKALGFRSDMNDKDLMYIMVELNEFHQQEIIEFVNYDERVYKFCSKGPTTKNSNGAIQAREGGNLATARDWYNFANENMLM